jgi:hypothetical protein
VTITDHGITVTMKTSGSHDATWMVFKAISDSELRHDLSQFFGIDVPAELTTHELVVNLTAVVQGARTASAMLGAVAIPAGKTETIEKPTGNVWAGLDDEEPAHPYQHVLDAISAASGVKELQAVWATNQAAFADETVTAAYKARGKALSQ